MLIITNIERIKDNIGICYLHLQNYAEAEPYLTKSILLLEQAKDTIQLIGSYGNLATLYYEQYKDAQAIPYFIKAYELAKHTDDFKSKKNTAKNMAVVEENRKNFPKAIEYLKEYDQWKDSINNQSRIYATAKAEEKIAVEKEQKQVAILEAKNEVQEAQRNTLLYSSIILLLLLATSFYFYREKVKSNKIINAQKESLDELNATKDKLFSIVSHDLRSSVNAIKTSNTKLVDTLETENLTAVNSLLQNNSSIVNGAYNLLDNLLNWAMLQTKQSYFEITKLRLLRIVTHVAYNYKAMLADKEISFDNNVKKNDVVFADQESLKIILRNLIDNAIKFSHPKGKIQIYTENKNDHFCNIIIEDEGMGMDNATREALLKDTILLSKKKHENIIGTGLGMQLCKSMTKKNNGKFSIESELGKGTKMIISLPKSLPNESY
ncbi:ATP-binding protein [Kordia sp.]|uniref:tetratricopeptide repeat-containing sensor histidine kinase n=1 Tax=Kordia sp. TaxID=1965332 RepID=UPI003D27139F